MHFALLATWSYHHYHHHH